MSVKWSSQIRVSILEAAGKQLDIGAAASENDRIAVNTFMSTASQ